MIYNLKLIENFGWVLQGKPYNWTNKCIRCGDDLKTPFFFCNQFKEGICKPCEISRFRRVCRSIEEEHEHFNIVRME